MGAVSFDNVGTKRTWDNPIGIPKPKSDAIPIESIAIPKVPYRELNHSKVDALARSIKTCGLLHRIAVNTNPGKGYILVTGYHRLMALKLLGEGVVPVLMFMDKLTKEQIEYLRAAENVHRAELTPEELKKCQATCTRIEKKASS